MTLYRWLVVVLCIIVPLAIAFLMGITGDGGFKRMVTISGIYSICRPDGYDVVCFLDADGKDGGMFCVPLSAVGGACKK